MEALSTTDPTARWSHIVHARFCYSASAGTAFPGFLATAHKCVIIGCRNGVFTNSGTTAVNALNNLLPINLSNFHKITSRGKDTTKKRAHLSLGGKGRYKLSG